MGRRTQDWAQRALDLNTQPYTPPATRDTSGLIDAVVTPLPRRSLRHRWRDHRSRAGVSMSSRITPNQLSRTAVLCVRQSTSSARRGIDVPDARDVLTPQNYRPKVPWDAPLHSQCCPPHRQSTAFT